MSPPDPQPTVVLSIIVQPDHRIEHYTLSESGAVLYTIDHEHDGYSIVPDWSMATEAHAPDGAELAAALRTGERVFADGSWPVQIERIP